MVVTLETERLRLRRVTEDDAAFVLRLLNEPSYLENIGDKGVRTLEDAAAYIRSAPMATYERFGFGMDAVELKETGAVVGMCGLLKREHLEHPDLGYAYLPEHWSRGYAVEAARGVLRHAREVLGLGTILAVTSLHNHASARVLERVGFDAAGLTGWTNGEQVRLFACDPAASPSIPARGAS